MNQINDLLFLFILLISIYNVSPFEIKIIPDANHNATAAFVLLEDLEKLGFLYFSFDFNYHNQVPQKIKDVAFFKITTELELFDLDFQYIFSEKNLEDINSANLLLDLRKNNNFWKYSLLFSKEKVNNEYNYYIQINRFVETKAKTLILRIPVAKKEGQLTIENLMSFPKEVEKKVNEIKNHHFRPKIEHNLGKNNMDILEDDKRYHYNKYHDNYYKYHSIRPNHNGQYYTHIHFLKPHKHYRYGKNIRIIRIVLFTLGSILSQIWIVIFVLYCLVNRKKKEQLAIVIGNMQQ